MPKTIWSFALLALAFASAAHAQHRAPLTLIDDLSLPEVHGRIDHFDVDLTHRRLFMAALGNNTVEIFDLRTNKPLGTIHGLHEPQGVTYASKSNRLFVANGDDGTVRNFDGSTYAPLTVAHLASDADDSRYDPLTNRVFIGYGSEQKAGLAILDGVTGKVLEMIRLPGHPESFQLEKSGSRVFVNIPTSGNTIAVVGRRERKIIATWALGSAEDNFPMALDENEHRLFVAARTPSEVLILDTDSGRIIARIPCVGHADDMWYDQTNRRIYVSGGSGYISVVQEEDVNHYRSIAQISTLPGARTSLLAPELNRLYLGVWGSGRESDALRVYEIQP